MRSTLPSEAQNITEKRPGLTASSYTIRSVELIDTHCHLDVAEFDPDRQAVLARARANGVTAIVVPGVMAPGWDYLWRFCASAPDLYPALGLHP